MTQSERLVFLLEYLIKESEYHNNIKIPTAEYEQKRLLRSLMNIRPALPASEEFLKVQDEYLKKEISYKGITDSDSLPFAEEKISIWQGDITTLKCGAIVNAANSALLGCFVPCHKCIDNAIHTYAGVGLRAECAEIMAAQGHEEAVGGAKITGAYNLPCEYVIHTVGPTVRGVLRKKDCDMLSSCYNSCMEAAERYKIRSIAFCCISTGEFGFPNSEAAEIAVAAVREHLKNSCLERVIFNVFPDKDKKLYEKLLK